MRALPLSLVLLGLALVLTQFARPAAAHHPNREADPVTPRVDVIPPLGNNLPPSYRRRYNRPRYLGGKIAYWIAPSSQEAMAWHKAAHRGDYREHRGRITYHYFYRRPWEALGVGSRNRSGADQATESRSETAAAGSGIEPKAPTFTPASRPVVVRPWRGSDSDAAEPAALLP